MIVLLEFWVFLSFQQDIAKYSMNSSKFVTSLLTICLRIGVEMGTSEEALTSVVSVAIVVLISSVSLISIRQCVLVLFLFVIAKLPQLSSWIFFIFFS